MEGGLAGLSRIGAMNFRVPAAIMAATLLGVTAIGLSDVPNEAQTIICQVRI